MKFLKENLYDIIKLYITQLGITIFALIMYTASGAISEDSTVSSAIQISISAFSILFYFTLLYTAAWDWGAKDKIRIDAGRITRSTTKGLKLSLLANVPNFLLAALAITSYIFCLNGIEEAFASIASISTLIIRFTAAMHQGIIKNVIDVLAASATPHLFYLIQTLAYLFMFILAAIVTHVGYCFGLREFRIFGFIKKQQNTNK